MVVFYFLLMYTFYKIYTSLTIVTLTKFYKSEVDSRAGMIGCLFHQPLFNIVSVPRPPNKLHRSHTITMLSSLSSI